MPFLLRLGLILLAFAAHARGAEILVKSGESIAFLGDSIIAKGAKPPNGYVSLAMAGLVANGVDATLVPAGVSGNTSRHMLARVQQDVIAKKPTWMLLGCGVNNVWMEKSPDGVPREEFARNVAAILDTARQTGITVLLCTATPIGESAKVKSNELLAPYNGHLRAVAKERKLILEDTNLAIREELERLTKEWEKTNKLLTIDGVHMNAEGNRFMAVCLLAAMGLDAQQLEKARKSWMAIPSPEPVAK